MSTAALRSHHPGSDDAVFHLPLRYFTFPYQDMTLDQEMQLLDQPDKMCHFLAHNGWVMGDDPLRNFAEPGTG